jgi:hypothetical protein
MKAIFYAGGVIGGVILFAGPFIPAARIAPRWIRIALLITGPACVVWGVLGYSLLWGVRDPYGFVRDFKSLSGGIAIGILVLLFASGEFRSSPRQDANQS